MKTIDELTIGEYKQLAQLFGAMEKKEQPDILAGLVGEKVIVRDNMAGVFVTTLLEVRGQQWRGGESRKIHYWEKAGAVQGIAQTGIDLEKSRIAILTSTSNGQSLVEICPAGDAVHAELMGAKVWNPKK